MMKWTGAAAASIVLILMALMPVALPAQTAEEPSPEGAATEEHAAGDHDEGAIPDPIERWFNFLVLFGGLGLLLRKPASAFFESRRSTIQGGLDRARAAQRDAEVRMSDITGRLSRFHAEVKQLEADADASARAEHERIVTDAQTEVDRTIDQSRAEVERLARELAREIRARLADQVVARAEQQLQSRMTSADQLRAVRKGLREL